MIFHPVIAYPPSATGPVYKPLIEKSRREFDRIIEFLEKEISSLRTGRATPALVENIEAEYYGARTPLKHLAAIHVAGPREIQIQPWDKNALKPIEEALQKSSLGIHPVVDKTIVRLTLPQLTEERRKEFVRLLKEKAEGARIAIRKERDDVLKKVEALFRDKKIGEDDKFRAKDEVQKTVDGMNKKIEEIAEKKEKEIMTI